MARTPYLHLNGARYQLSQHYAEADSRSRETLETNLRRALEGEQDYASWHLDVVIDGVATQLHFNMAAVTSFALYVVEHAGDDGRGHR